MDPLKLTPVEENGRRGQSVEIPLSLGPRKEGQDEEKGMYLVFDFVVSPATLDAAQKTPTLMKTLCETVSV